MNDFRRLLREKNAGLLAAALATGVIVWWSTGIRAATEAPLVERVTDSGWRESSQAIVAGGWATIAGQNLGRGSTDGISVEIGGKAASVRAARTSDAGDELDVIVPLLEAGSWPLVVAAAGGRSAPYGVNVVQFQPSLLSVPVGEDRHVDAATQDGKERIGPFDLSGRKEGELASRPAAPLERLSLFVNGCGWWDGLPEPGVVAQKAVAFGGGATATIGGEPAEVLYAGVAVGRAGQCQVDVKVPLLAAGTHEVGLEFGGAKAQSGVLLEVKEVPYPGFEHGRQSKYRLSGAHVFVECTQCHVRSRFWGTPSACEACHMDRYARTTAPNHEEAGFPADCVQCHQTSSFTVTRFGHGQGQFPLTGKHRTLVCSACHTAGLGEKPDAACVGCHLKDYEGTANPQHASAGIGKDCGVCHTPEGWKGAKVDHSRSGFPLTGKHASAGCVSCHKEGATGKPDKACSACHLAQYESAASPNHKAAGYPTGCDACHTPAGWKPAKVDHPRQRFPLEGKHAALQCTQCHKDGLLGGLASACVSCHLAAYEQTAAPAHGAAGFPKTCESCHTPAGWKGATIPHTQFALTGKHAQTPCASCHVDGKFAGTAKACAGCHQAQYDAAGNPDHRGLGYPVECQLCHSTSQFKGARFLHSSFTLEGKHAALACSGCHASGRYLGTARECSGCHLARYNATVNPNHAAAGFPVACQTCHTPAGWTPSTFAHTVFALTGRHTAVACSGCHVSGQYAGTVRECSGCHLARYTATTSPSHVAGGYPTTCQMCHTTAGWRPSSFTHSVFALTGKHVGVKCFACHIDGKYLGTPRECVGCHLDDYNATSQPSHLRTGFPTTCQNCHTTAGWKPAQFPHSFLIYSSKHAGKWSSCGDCHIDSANFKSVSCAKCHPKSKMDEEHHELKGYLYDFPTCLKCHPAGSKP